MFDNTSFELNDTILGECRKLISEHNKLSYVDISLDVSSISYSFISKSIPRDPLLMELVSFYEIFTFQRISAYSLKNAIDLMDYTHEDLAMHVERSEDSIIQLMSSITGIRARLLEYYDNINANIINQTNTFIDYISHTNIDDISQFIDIIFVCMRQEGIETNVNIEPGSHYFVNPGSRLIEVIYPQIFKANLTSYVHSKLNELKQFILITRPSLHGSFEAINKLQTFNLLPDDGANVDIKTAISILLNIDVDISDLSQDMQIAESVCKQISIDKETSIGLFIITSINNDVYFDMSSLGELQQLSDTAGVSKNLIDKTNLLKHGPVSKIKKSNMLTINITPETEEAYILWTNDMKQFKIKSKSINNALIKKIIRRSPSSIIESYNRIITESINKQKRYDDAIAFKRVQYMTFNNSITEEVFIKSINATILEVITNEIKSHKDNLHDWLLTDEFYELMLDSLNSLKSSIGIHPSMLSAHCHIIYNSMASKIVNKIKRKMLELHDIPDPEKIKQFIDDASNGNDNIYTRTIASYYLHIA